MKQLGISEASLEDICTQIMLAQTDRNLFVQIMPRSLHVEPDYYILDFDHRVVKVDRRRWIEWLSNRDNTRVVSTKLDSYLVSTVFLICDHGFGDGLPVLFETMVFKGEDYTDAQDDYTRRYCSWDEALAGHAEVVKEVGDVASH